LATPRRGEGHLGQTNTVSKSTHITAASKKAATLVLANTGGQPALSLSVASGVAPFAVNSSTKVASLNADLLDGIDSSGFYRAGSKVADSALLDGIASSGFYKAGSKVADSALLNGIDSNGFYKTGSKVSDSDLLDGLDSSAFQLRITGTCSTGSAISAVNTNGSVVCQSIGTGGTTPPPAWSLSGNAGTTPGTNFLGTTDNTALVLKTNNTEALRIDASGNVGIGVTSPAARVDASGLIALMGTATSSGPAIVGRLGTTQWSQQDGRSSHRRLRG
jgi:hypothetical protein